MSDFDPWTADFEDARAAQAEFDKRRTYGQKWYDPRQPIFMWAGVQYVNELCEEIESGGESAGFAILAAMRKCAQVGLVMPVWLGDAYIRRYDQVLTCRSDSWDEVFGRPYPKGAHLHPLRGKRLNRILIANEVYEILQKKPETSINKKLFEEVGKRINKSGSYVEKLYPEAKRLYLDITPK